MSRNKERKEKKDGVGGRDESVGLRNIDACDTCNGGIKSEWDGLITELQRTASKMPR